MPPSLGVYKDISYLHPFNRHRTFDLFVPAPPRNPGIPLLIFIHGGAWRAGDKEEYHAQARFWASNKRYPLAVAVINYRLSSMDEDGGPIKYPDHVHDCAAAIKWFRYPGRNAYYGYDPDRIFLVGHSVGAQLAGVLTLDPRWLGDDYRAIRGVVGVQGVYDLPKLVDSMPFFLPFVEAAFGRREDEEKRLWIYASPQYLLLPDHYRMAPQLIVHSPEDDALDGDQAVHYRDHLRSIVSKEAQAPGYPAPDPERRIQLITQLSGGHYEVLLSPEFPALVVNFVDSIYPESRGSSATLATPSPIASGQVSRSPMSPASSNASLPSAQAQAQAQVAGTISVAAQPPSPALPSPASNASSSLPNRSPVELTRESSVGSLGSSGGKEKKTLASFFHLGKSKSTKK